MIKKISLVFAFSALALPAQAQMVESKITASNGVTVSKNSDEFAERYEYSAPDIKFKSEKGADGFALVAKMRRAKVLGELNIQGFFIYSGEWKFFTSAVFKGGDPVNYTRLGGDVSSCRYGCTLTENFFIKISDEEIKKHSIEGFVSIQIRSKGLDTAILSIPVEYITAVNEVAK